ncbi:MAG: DUF2007 domain-containing protein [Anaerolineae bacterium]|nr:DUF2007 domain-containing protein [Anaerolineae bacterium]
MNVSWKKVYTANGQLEAETIRLFLQSFQIPSVISQESAGVTFGFTVGPLGQAQIYVRSEDAERAEEALKHLENGTYVDDAIEQHLDETEEQDGTDAL